MKQQRRRRVLEMIRWEGPSKISRKLPAHSPGGLTPNSDDSAQLLSEFVGGGWEVTQHLDAGLKNVEECMRERQALFGTQELWQMEPQRIEAERERRNTAPGLGDILMVRMSIRSIYDDDGGA